MIYVAFIHQDEAPGYGISFPDFPGCVSHGDSIENAIRLGREALGFHAEGLLADGMALPAPRSVDAIMADGDLAEWREGAQIAHVPLMLRSWLSAPRQCLARLRAAAGNRRGGTGPRHDTLGLSVERRAQGARRGLTGPGSRRPRRNPGAHGHRAHHMDPFEDLVARQQPRPDQLDAVGAGVDERDQRPRQIGDPHRGELPRIGARGREARHRRAVGRDRQHLDAVAAVEPRQHLGLGGAKRAARGSSNTNRRPSSAATRRSVASRSASRITS